MSKRTAFKCEMKVTVDDGNAQRERRNDVTVVLDVSGSMSGSKLSAALD
eukprot:SAG11_NODE_24659_length_370_cov_0.575646_1_plen_48_part_10